MSLEQNPRQNDVVEDVEGLKILTDKSNVEFLRGCTIDYMDTLQKRGFKIENPNVEAEGCGCGGH
jgi:iron-sulfur cluster assembly accessory protein